MQEKICFNVQINGFYYAEAHMLLIMQHQAIHVVKIGNMVYSSDALLISVYEKFPSTIFHCLFLRNVSLGPEDLKNPHHLHSTNTSSILCGAEGGNSVCACIWHEFLWNIWTLTSRHFSNSISYHCLRISFHFHAFLQLFNITGQLFF